MSGFPAVSGNGDSGSMMRESAVSEDGSVVVVVVVENDEEEEVVAILLWEEPSSEYSFTLDGKFSERARVTNHVLERRL